MKGAFQMLDGEKKNFIVEGIISLFINFVVFFILHFFADQPLEFVCVSLFCICKFCDLYQYDWDNMGQS